MNDASDDPMLARIDAILATKLVARGRGGSFDINLVPDDALATRALGRPCKASALTDELLEIWGGGPLLLPGNLAELEARLDALPEIVVETPHPAPEPADTPGAAPAPKASAGPKFNLPPAPAASREVVPPSEGAVPPAGHDYWDYV
jgi:hypothetical protein